MSRIGFDFGTSYCSVATSVKCRPEIKLSRQKKRYTPSVVAVHDGRISVGEEGLPDKTGALPDLKRIIGLPYDDEMVKRYREDLQIKLEDVDGAANVKVHCEKEIEQLRVDELVSFLFRDLTRSMKAIAITVPASFERKQREAIKDAALIAGFRKVKLIEETTAAAVSLATRIDMRKNTTLIFQLGGGTIDVAIFSIARNLITVLGNACSRYLGGIEFDRNLLKYALGKAGLTVESSKQATLMKKCKEAKEKLGKTNYTEITHERSNLHVQISKGEFEIANQDLLSVIETMIDMALEAANVKEVDKYILVGGGCAIPYVEMNIARKLGKNKRRYDVDMKEEAVKGAAIYSETGSGIIQICNQMTRPIIITINDGRVKHGPEAEKLLVKSLSALRRVSSNKLDMEIIVRSRDCSGSLQVNQKSSREAELKRDVKRRRIDESVRKVNKFILKHKEYLKTEDLVDRIHSKATNLQQDSEKEIRKYESVNLVSKDAVKWIKDHDGPFAEEELYELDRKLDEKRKLLPKEDTPGIFRRIGAWFIALFWRILECCRCFICCRRTTAEESRRVMDSTENQENEKDKPEEQYPSTSRKID